MYSDLSVLYTFSVTNIIEEPLRILWTPYFELFSFKIENKKYLCHVLSCRKHYSWTTFGIILRESVTEISEFIYSCHLLISLALKFILTIYRNQYSIVYRILDTESFQVVSRSCTLLHQVMDQLRIGVFYWIK